MVMDDDEMDYFFFTFLHEGISRAGGCQTFVLNFVYSLHIYFFKMDEFLRFCAKTLRFFEKRLRAKK